MAKQKKHNKKKKTKRENCKSDGGQFRETVMHRHSSHPQGPLRDNLEPDSTPSHLLPPPPRLHHPLS